MNKTILTLILAMMVLATSVFATTTITISVPVNSSTITDRTPDYTFLVVTDNETATYACELNIGAYSVTESSVTNNTATSGTFTSIIPDGTYVVNATCDVDASSSGNYYVTIDAFGYGTSDIAPSAIDFLVTIIVGVLGFASVIGLILLWRMLKKK